MIKQTVMAEQQEKTQKRRSPRRKILYLRELSVVVVGIVITLGANGLINKVQEKKDVREYLDAIRMELEENLSKMGEYREFYRRNGELSDLIATYGIDAVPQDSLARYDDIFNNIISIAFKTNAFEMMKDSGAMRLIKDKEFLQSIWASYSLLERFEHNSNSYMDRKLNETYLAVQESNTPNLDDMSNPHQRRWFSFYAFRFGIDNIMNECIEKIEETLTLF